jgi:hypothetical protein
MIPPMASACQTAYNQLNYVFHESGGKNESGRQELMDPCQTLALLDRCRSATLVLLN